MKAAYERVDFGKSCSVRVYHRRLPRIPFEWHHHPEYSEGVGSLRTHAHAALRAAHGRKRRAVHRAGSNRPCLPDADRVADAHFRHRHAVRVPECRQLQPAIQGCEGIDSTSLPAAVHGREARRGARRTATHRTLPFAGESATNDEGNDGQQAAPASRLMRERHAPPSDRKRGEIERAT